MSRAGVAIVFLFLLQSTAQSQRGDWRYYGGDAGSTKFAPHAEIDRDNFADLRVIWRWRPPEAEILKKHDVYKNYYRSTPVIVDGVLYTSSPFGIVAALDAATGEELWRFDPESWRDQEWFPSTHRGVAYWEEGKDKRVLFGTTTGYLYSLYAETGRPDPAFGDSGRVDLTRGMRREAPRGEYLFVSPPMVHGGLAIVGSSIPDIRGRPVPRPMPPGDVRAFDVRTGAQQWGFETIPQEGDFGHETWGEDSWKDFGGANMWSMMSLDSELGYVYLPISTPSNDFYGGERPGDNLFGDSIVCLNAQTGERVWHYQLVHHGLWDYDPPAAPILVDIEADGKPIKAVVQLTKQAFCFVFDRLTGEPVWPIVEMPVPASTIAGEVISDTQPLPIWPLPYDRQGLSVDDLTDFTPELRQKALEAIKGHSYGSLYTPPSERGSILVPGLLGGSDWSGGAVHPTTGVLYVPSKTMPYLVTLRQADEQAASAYSSVFKHNFTASENLPLTKPPYGRLTAIDLNTGEHLWTRAIGRGPVDHPLLRDLEIKEDLGWPSRTFPLLTATLLLTVTEDPRDYGFGPAAGQGYFVDREAYLRAFDPATGELVGQVELPGNAYASPATYQVAGRQYVVVALGDYLRPSELVALAIPRRDETLPEQGKDREDADHRAFYQAVEALDTGDLKQLTKLLKKHKGLAQARGFLDEWYEFSNLRGATLLHLTAGVPLRAALPDNALDIAQALLAAGADPDAATLDSVTTAELAVTAVQLEWAGIKGQLLSLLYEQGADPNRNNGKVLHDLLTDRKTELAEVLLDAGASVDLRFAAGLNRTDLMASFFKDGAPTPEANRLYRANPDTILTSQQVVDEALHYAVYSVGLEAIDFLLEKGADIDALVGGFWEWDWGSTALHKAVDTEDTELIRYLIAKGADPSVSDARWGETPYDWSGYYDNGAMREVLREYEEAAEQKGEQ